MTSACTTPCSAPPAIVPAMGTPLMSEASAAATAGAAALTPRMAIRFLPSCASKFTASVEIHFLPINAGQIEDHLHRERTRREQIEQRQRAEGGCGSAGPGVAIDDFAGLFVERLFDQRMGIFDQAAGTEQQVGQQQIAAAGTNDIEHPPGERADVGRHGHLLLLLAAAGQHADAVRTVGCERTASTSSGWTRPRTCEAI